MSRIWTFGQGRSVQDDADAIAENGSSEEHISQLEDELKEVVVLEAEAVRRFNSARKREAALHRELHQARRLILDEASQARAALLAQTDAILEAARADANEIIKEASNQTEELLAEAKQESAALVDAGRDEVKALEANAVRRIADLDAEHEELTHRLSVMETLYDELQETLHLVAEISIEELAQTQESLRQLQSTALPLSANKEQTTADPTKKERPESAGENPRPHSGEPKRRPTE